MPKNLQVLTVAVVVISMMLQHAAAQGDGCARCSSTTTTEARTSTTTTEAPVTPEPTCTGHKNEQPCQNGGTVRHYTAYPVPYGCFCECVNGYEGDYCEVEPTTTEEPTGTFTSTTSTTTTEEPLAECAQLAPTSLAASECCANENPCQNDGVAALYDHECYCKCVNGYTGANCEDRTTSSSTTTTEEPIPPRESCTFSSLSVGDDCGQCDRRSSRIACEQPSFCACTTGEAVRQCSCQVFSFGTAAPKVTPGPTAAPKAVSTSGKKGKKAKSPKEPKSSKSPKEPKSPKESKSPKGSKGPKGPKGPKGKAAGLAAKRSQAAKLEVGAGVALVGMVGLVALVATKLQASVAAKDEATALLVTI